MSDGSGVGQVPDGLELLPIPPASLDEIRFLRLRADAASGRPDLDLITAQENLTWRFAKGPASAEPVRAIGALLAERMGVPAREREVLMAGAKPAIGA